MPSTKLKANNYGKEKKKTYLQEKQVHVQTKKCHKNKDK